MTSVHLISHTEHSYDVEHSSVIGEVPNAKKFRELLLENKDFNCEIYDLYSLFGIQKLEDDKATALRQSVSLNVEMASIGEELISESSSSQNAEFLKQLSTPLNQDEDNILFFFTWLLNIYAILGTGIHKRFPSVSKLYCWHPGELSSGNGRHLIQPYLETDLIVCESPLAAAEALRAGVPPWKLLYLPHIYPLEVESIAKESEKERLDYRNAYIQRVAEENGKTIEIEEDTLVIGYSTRFQRGKNVEFLIGAVSELIKDYPNIILLIKGETNSNWDFGSDYTEKLEDAFAQVGKAPWFLWDRSFTPFPDVFRIYRSFDICAYPSGAESASNTLAETLSLGVPTVALEASTNPSLFNEMLLFAKPGELLKGKVPFHQPDFMDFMLKLRMLIESKELRRELGKKALEISRKRFAPDILSKRLPTLIKATRSYHKHDAKEKSCQKELSKQLEQDFSDYGIQI